MSDVTEKGLTTYDEVLAEEQRLKALLEVQKLKIRKDIQALKEEFNPVVAVARGVGKMMSADKQNHAAVQAGANLTIDWLVQKLMPHSGFMIKMLLPRLLKNYTSHYVDQAVDKAAPALRKFGSRLTAVARKE
jgi:hypothetical protein